MNQPTYQEAFRAAVALFTEHVRSGCDACRIGGAFARLAHHDDMREKAAKQAGFPTAHARLIRAEVTR